MHPIAAVLTHSTGVNWGQAAATWIPIVGTLIGLVLMARRGLGGLVDSAIKIFAATLQVKFTEIQSEFDKLNERVERIDKNTKTDSR